MPTIYRKPERTPFIGRQRELDLLKQLWRSPKAELLILYGRRRVGKTRLLTHWLEIDQPRAMFWVGEPTSAHEQLTSFSQAVYNFANPGLPAPESFSYASWAQAFQQIARLAQDERLAVIIDEFTYLLAVEAGLAGILQNTWDHVFSQCNLLLVIAGSHIGMLERSLLAYQAPLYGRATALLKLAPLSFADTRQFFPKISASERVSIFGMLGGIPAYWERYDQQAGVDQNIRTLFLETNTLLQDEPRLLLQDFVSEAHNYLAILRAIAHNNRTPKEIAAYAGLVEKHVPAYLARLSETGFVVRKTSVTAPPAARSGRHFIVDPFLRFYFRFLSRRQAQLALGVQDQALIEIKRHLTDFIGAHTWEELCQEWLLRASAHGQLPCLPDQVGSAWTKKAQVDVVGVNSMEKTLILGECKWGAQEASRAVLRELAAKTPEVVPSAGRWQVHYLGFARSGWTAEAQQFASELPGMGLQGDNWQAVSMRLLDLEQIDHDLDNWNKK